MGSASASVGLLDVGPGVVVVIATVAIVGIVALYFGRKMTSRVDKDGIRLELDAAHVEPSGTGPPDGGGSRSSTAHTCASPDQLELDGRSQENERESAAITT